MWLCPLSHLGSVGCLPHNVPIINNIDMIMVGAWECGNRCCAWSEHIVTSVRCKFNNTINKKSAYFDRHDLQKSLFNQTTEQINIPPSLQKRFSTHKATDIWLKGGESGPRGKKHFCDCWKSPYSLLIIETFSNRCGWKSVFSDKQNECHWNGYKVWQMFCLLYPRKSLPLL